MGITKHEAVITTVWSDEAEVISAFREQMPEAYRHLLVGSGELVNGTYSSVFFPDGYNEGGGTEAEIDALRHSFIVLLASMEAIEWAHVVLYDEKVIPVPWDWMPRIVASSRSVWDGNEYVQPTPNMHEAVVYRLEHLYMRDGVKSSYAKDFETEGAAVASVLAHALRNGREWVQGHRLMRILNQESGEREQTELIASDDALFDYALQRGLKSYY